MSYEFCVIILLMINRYKHRKLVWIDLESPTSDEVRKISDEYNIHPLVARELTSPSDRAKVELHHNFIYLILHFPELHHGHSGVGKKKEVDFIIGKNFIITTRFDSVDPLHSFSKVFEVNSILDKSHLGDHAGFIFFYMIRKLYESLAHELEFMQNSVERIEESIFNGEEREMVRQLSIISRALLDLKRATSMHQEILESFQLAGRKFFGESFAYHLRAIMGEYCKVANAIDNQTEFVKELRDTNDSLLDTKQNEIMKTLTILAFVFLPISFIAAIYSMNTIYLPIVGTKGDFFIIIAIMLLIVLSIIAIFKRKKWL